MCFDSATGDLRNGAYASAGDCLGFPAVRVRCFALTKVEGAGEVFGLRRNSEMGAESIKKLQRSHFTGG